MASLQNQKTVSGNMIQLKVKGIVIGRAQNLDPRVSYGTEGVYEIGSIMPQEHIHLRYEGVFSLERYLMTEQDLAQAGLIGLGEDILEMDIIDVEIINKTTGKTLRVYRGCTFTDYTNTFRVGAIAGENATVQYLSIDTGE